MEMMKELKKLFPLALVNITNRCNLRCRHCFVFREGNPNKPTEKNEMTTDAIIKEIKSYKRKYGISRMLWMGGEPLLRKDVLKRGVKLFPQNVITTNGTLPLFNLGPSIKWVISIDGPEELSDEIRGKGSFKRVIHNLNNLPEDFTGDLQCNSVVTKMNEDCFEELINVLKKETPIRGINLTFYVPKKRDKSEFTWKSLKERDLAVRKIINLKKKYPKFILNNNMVLELLFSQNAPQITKDCILRKIMLPLYLGNDGFELPFCCYGNDVDCDLCGSWAVFHLALIMKLNPGFPYKLTGSNFKKVTPSGITL
jgi:sulfatase maturation enzyme AslB (radical SAM superfamily)